MKLIMNAAELMEKEAIGFAMWLSDEMYTPHDRKSRYWYDTHGKEFHTRDLYEMYSKLPENQS